MVKQKSPSIIDVAKAAGVGTTTVSRVISGKGYVSKESRTKVEKAINEISYSPSHAAQSLRSRQSSIVALFVPKLDHPFFSKMTECIEKELYLHHFRMVLSISQGNMKKESEIITMFNEGLVDGVVFITHNHYKNLDLSRPIVTIDRHLGDDIPFVTSDNYEATTQALQRLFDKGARSIGFLGGKPSVTSEVGKRYQAYLDFVRAKGLKEEVTYEDIRHGEENALAHRFILEHGSCDAVFCGSDYLGLAVYEEALATHRAIPDDFKIIAYDGAISDSFVRLSVCQQNIPLMAKKVVKLLLLRMEGKNVEHVSVVPTDFVEGQTD